MSTPRTRTGFGSLTRTSTASPAQANRSSPRDRILALREAIETEIRAVADHVSQWIAHRDREAKAPITWGELHNAVDRIGERLGEVSVMLTGGFQMPKPTIQFDWKDVMRRGVFHRPLREWTEWDIRFSRSFT